MDIYFLRTHYDHWWSSEYSNTRWWDHQKNIERIDTGEVFSLCSECIITALYLNKQRLWSLVEICSYFDVFSYLYANNFLHFHIITTRLRVTSGILFLNNGIFMYIYRSNKGYVYLLIRPVPFRSWDLRSSAIIYVTLLILIG